MGRSFNRRSKKKTYSRRYKKRSMRKQAIAPRVGGKITQPVHYFKRWMPYAAVSSAINESAVYGSVFVRAQDIPGFSEFASLYDSYKINAVKVMFFPLSDNTTSVSNQSESYLRIFTVLDYNDRSVPVSLLALREYDNCKISSNNKVHKRYFKPAYTLDIESTDLSATPTNYNRPWLSTAASNAEHFGLKYGIETLSLGTVVNLYRVEVKVYLSFKSKR